MTDRWRADDRTPDAEDTCYVRWRRAAGRHPGVVYEAVCRRGEKLEVLAEPHRGGPAPEAAGDGLLQFRAHLQHEGWEPTAEPCLVGADIIACYIRPGRHHAS